MDNSNQVEEQPEEQSEMTLLQSITKNAIGLALFALVTAGVIAVVKLNTATQIQDNIAQAQAKALYEIVPEALVDNDLLNDILPLNLPSTRKQLNIHLLGPIDSQANIHFAKSNDKLHTLIFPVVAPDGYTTAIKLLVGIKLDGTLAGVRIVGHKETPGLGDKIELKKSDWVLSFNDKSLLNPDSDKWKVKKNGGEFDSFTGATITPRAVINAVKQALVFYQDYQTTILELKKSFDLQQANNVQLKSQDIKENQQGVQ